MKRWQRWGIKGLLGMGLWLAGAPSAWGQSTIWTNASGGLWNTAANWSNLVPVPAGTAIFWTVTGSYTVQFDVSPTTSGLTVIDGNVTFNLFGQTYTPAASAFIGSGTSSNGRLTITNGAVASGAAQIGSSLVSTGSLTVSTGGSWTTGASTTIVGGAGTGTLTINNGGVYTTSALALGNATTGTGTLSLSGAGSSLSMTTFTVGSSGSGTVTISGGATATGTSNAIIASSANSNGSLTMTGAGSALNIAGTLNLANSAGAVGAMTISNGGTVSNTSSIIGISTGGTATVLVTGTNAKWTNSSGLFVGGSGSGTLNISASGDVSANGLTIGNNAGGTGSVTLSGSGSSFDAVNGITIGSTGTGAMTIDAGATVTAGGTTTVSASTGTLNLNGGTLDTVGFTRNGTFNFNDGTLYVRGTFTANPSLSALSINGNDDAALPALRLSGNFATNNISNLVVGNTRQGAMILDGGRVVALGAQNISIGASAGSNGSITLTGAGSSLTNTLNLDVGGGGGLAGGTGTLTINPGASVSTGTLTLHPQGTLNLDGILAANTINANGGRLNWNSGLLSLQSPALFTNSNLDAILGVTHVLGAGRELDVNGVATVSAPMSISGGLFFTNGTTNNSIFQIDSGIASASTFTNNAGRVIVVSGTGSLIGNTAIANNGTLQLNNNLVPTTGGTLTNAGTIRGTGYIGNNLTNASAGQVQVTTGNRIEFQGSANTNSGLISMVGGEVIFTGPLTNSANTGLISGRDAILRTGGITNNGSLAFSNGTMDVFGDITQNIGGRITISGGGNVNFYDDVTIASGAASVQASAAGGTVSKVVFFGSYNGGVTGGGTAFIEGDHRPGNSPGLVTFGGDVFYGGISRLFVELGGKNRGTQYDAIDVTGSVTVSGDLILTHINSFNTLGGETFLLINNDGNDPINGFFNNLPEGATFLADNHLFQISYQGGSGNDLTISAVPEPTTWVMIALGGLAAAGYGYRRLRQRQAATDLVID